MRKLRLLCWGVAGLCGLFDTLAQAKDITTEDNTDSKTDNANTKTGETDYSLGYYISQARRNSPLLGDYRNRKDILQAEEDRLKALYKQARIELTGEYLFVPVVSAENGKTTFQWNAQDGTDYWGYDLGQSSGHFTAGATWTRPLLGKSLYRTAQEAARADNALIDHNIRLEKHQLERSVTEQYLLCLLDRAQMACADSAGALLRQQAHVTNRLIRAGFARVSDTHLLAIEEQGNNDARAAWLQSYRTHLTELNILCGIRDTTYRELRETEPALKAGAAETSPFMQKFVADSLKIVAEQKIFDAQYKPQLNVFASTGLQVGRWRGFEKHFGLSGGLSFSWTLFDGHQRRFKERQTRAQLNSVRIYRQNFLLQNDLRKRQCLNQLRAYDERCSSLRKQLEEYDRLLLDYKKEIAAGQRSLLDYITVLRNKIQTEKDYLLLRTNRHLMVVAFNYWNW